MKILLSTIIYLLVNIEISFTMTPNDPKNVAQNVSQYDTIASEAIILGKASADSNDRNRSIDSAKLDSGEVVITVSPAEANDASIMLIRKNKIEVNSHSISTYPFEPDTIGQWNAPLSLRLSLGIYDIILRKDGFKAAITERTFTQNRDSIPIEMFSLTYLQHKHDQWRTANWICAGVAAVAGIASYYFHNRIDAYKNEYDTAVSLSVIQDKRDSLSRNRAYYRISSGIAFTSIGCFAVTWLIENSY
ncbi:MAG: hypothetical protein WBZ48_04415 [Bacteroidota bacterium]